MYLVFIGQNANTGTPNKSTGLYSNYGDFKKFDTKQSRDCFYNNWYSNNPYKFIRKGTENTLRKYALGMTKRDYLDYLESLTND